MISTLLTFDICSLKRELEIGNQTCFMNRFAYEKIGLMENCINSRNSVMELLIKESQADEWKYLPIRRTALYIEESIYRGTRWVVFEPNDERLWSEICANVRTFMSGLFKRCFRGK
jgi:hypothetical protein